MNRIMKPMLKRITVRRLLLAACIIPLALQPFTASRAVAATTLPVLWTAGGLSAGTDSAGQAARIATDASGNVAVVSGPSGGRDLAVTSYTANGTFRWRGVDQSRRWARSRQTGWSPRPTAISWRSVTTSLPTAVRSPSPWSATPPTGRCCGAWEVVRDGGLNTDEVPTAVLVLADGTTVVTGPGGPNLPGGYIQGVTAGYSSNGTLLWEAFSRMATTWATALPNSDVCASGGYDALMTCWRVSGVVMSTPSPTPGPTNTPVPKHRTVRPFLPRLPLRLHPAQTLVSCRPPPAPRRPATLVITRLRPVASAYADDASFAIDTKSGTNTSCTDMARISTPTTTTTSTCLQPL